MPHVVSITNLLHFTPDWSSERKQAIFRELTGFESFHEVYRQAEFAHSSLSQSVTLRPPRDKAELAQCNLLIEDGSRFLKIAYRIKDEKTRHAHLNVMHGSRFDAAFDDQVPGGDPGQVLRYAEMMARELAPLPDLVNDLIKAWGRLRGTVVQHHSFPIPDWVVLSPPKPTQD